MAREELKEFLLNRDGGLGVVVTIDRKNGNTHAEFENQVNVSKVTVGKRLKEAVDIGIFERARHPDDHGNTKRYVLTDEGKALRIHFGNHNLKSRYEELQDKREEMNNWIKRTIIKLDEYDLHE
jgi:DNA-binding MarR family transcriptional regulator